MVPPNKRRRLTGPRSRSWPSRIELIAPEPTPTLFHSVEPLEHKSASAATRTVPQHIQEIHLQIQEKPFHGGSDEYGRIHRRQATAVETVITSVDDNGNTIMTTETIGLVTTTTSASSAAASSTGTGTVKQTASGSRSQASGNSSVTSSTPTGASGTLSHNTASDNSTSSHNSTKHTTGHTSDHTSSHTTLASSLYLVTLKNGHVETLTRSNKPYITTLANGRQSTICDLHSDCTILTHKDETTQKSHQTRSLNNAVSSTVTSTAFVAAGPAQGTRSSSTSSTGTTAQHHSNDNSTPPAGTIAGGVVGGAAGIAVLLLIALIFLRWYKRRSQEGHHALPPSSTMSPDPDQPSISTSPGMAERAGLMPLVGAVPGFFRHQNRSQEVSEAPSSERGFTKVSGRKLPSAFSEGMSSGGMSSPPPNMPLTGPERNLSSTSFYRDSYGFYGGEGSPAELQASPVGSPERGSPDQGDHDVAMTLSPGPQRTPTVHNAGPYVMSPSTSVPNTPRIPQTIPASPPRNSTPTFTRSDTPSTDNRSSKFTEEV